MSKRAPSPNENSDTYEASDESKSNGGTVSEDGSDPEEETVTQSLSDDFLKGLHAVDTSISLQEMVEIAKDKGADLRNLCCDPDGSNPYYQKIEHTSSLKHKGAMKIGKSLPQNLYLLYIDIAM